jgi:hypothetical protein
MNTFNNLTALESWRVRWQLFAFASALTGVCWLALFVQRVWFQDASAVSSIRVQVGSVFLSARFDPVFVLLSIWTAALVAFFFRQVAKGALCRPAP